MNIRINGIRPDDVAHSPEFVDIWPAIETFAEGLPLVAHNAAFDIGALRDLFAVYQMDVPTVDYFCTLILSRRLLDLVSYSLPIVARELGVSMPTHNRAKADAISAAQITLALLERAGSANLYELAHHLGSSHGHFDASTWIGPRLATATGGTYSRAAIEAIRSSIGEVLADPNGALFGKHVAFTGGLVSMTRAEAASRVIAAGGEPDVRVRKFTDFLVIGVENGYTLDPRTATTAKFEKAKQLRKNGSMIEILDELTFVRMI